MRGHLPRKLLAVFAAEDALPVATEPPVSSFVTAVATLSCLAEQRTDGKLEIIRLISPRRLQGAYVATLVVAISTV